MVSNTARKLAKEHSKNRRPIQQSQPVPVQRVAWSPFERLLVGVGSIVTLCLIITLLSTKVTINNQQHHLQDLQTQISKTHSANTSSQQEIAELTSQGHLKTVAHKYGLSDKNSNVRNVNK